LKYYDIRPEGSDAGVVTAASHPRVDTIAQVTARVKKLIDGAEKQEGEIKAALVEKGYEELRGLCEIIVEHEMLKGVVQRYAPNVMMTKLDKINVTKLQESMAAIVPVFEKCCRYVASHSQPDFVDSIQPKQKVEPVTIRDSDEEAHTVSCWQINGRPELYAEPISRDKAA
jgi:hypothetical protein